MQWRRHRILFLALTCSWVLAQPASARDFRLFGADGLLDLTFSYGLDVRLEDRDPNLIGVSNGGDRASVNADDGTLNYDKGIVSNMVGGNAQLVLTRRWFGLYMSGSAFYDYENARRERERTALSASTKALVGKDARLRESYLSARFNMMGVPVQIRAGDQIVRWGETTFVRDGVDVINPIDLVSALQPASQEQDFTVPQGMVWGVANVSETLSIEAYYQYSWERVDLPPVGTYFSSLDLLGGEGVNFATLGAGEVSDLGTDLDTQFALPVGTLGFDESFFKIFGTGARKPDGGGQYGIRLVTIRPGRNALALGLQFIRYHSRLPLIDGATADAAAVAQTSSAAVAARAAPLVPAYESTGLGPAEAADAALEAAAELSLSEYANEAGYFAVYPQNIEMLGFTFNTTTLRGMLFSGEISHHFDYPFQVAVDDVLNATLSPVLFDPAIGTSALGEFGPNQVVNGVKRLGRTQATIEVAKVFSRKLGADQLLISSDIAWSGIEHIPHGAQPPLEGTGGVDENSFGYRLTAVLNYSGVFGAINLAPRIVFIHDFRGTTPAPLSTFVEGRKSLSIGLNANYINRLVADVSYNAFFGGRRDLLNDRDYLRASVTYSF